MSAQVPERACLAPSLCQILPHGLHVVEIAEVAELHQLLQLANRGMEEQQMLDHQPASLAAGQLDKNLSLPAGQRQWLRHEDVLRGFQGPAYQLEMRVRRRCDRDRIDRLVCEQVVEPARHPDIREAVAHELADLAPAIAEPGHVGAGKVDERADELRSPGVEPDDADVDGLRHPRRMLTTSVTARSPRPSSIAPANATLIRWSASPGSTA